MATTTEVFKVEIEGQERAIGSMKDLKTAIKDAQNSVIAGTPGANKALASLKDKLEDVKDSATSVKGDGVEPLRNSFALFKDGLSDMDLGKIGTAFKGLGAAMKAVPIFLLVEGITYLITNFKELSEGTGILAEVLKPIGDLIGWIKDGLYALTDAIGLTNTALDEMGESTVKNAEASKEALSQQNAEYDRQIKVAKAAGESTVELEKAKQQAIIDTNVQIVKQIEAFVRAGGVLDDKKKKLLTASLEGIKNANTEQIVIEEQHQQEIKKKDKAAALERKKIADKENKEAAARVQAKLEILDAFYTAGFQKEVAFAQAKLDYQSQVDAVLDEQAAKKAQKSRDLLAQEDAKIIANLEKRKEGYRQFEQSKFELSKQSIQSIQAITDLVFAHQLRQAAGNAAKEREIKKKQFNLNKAFGIAGATIDGVQAVQKALNNPYPLNIVLAILSGAMAVANVVKIASTKFDDGGGSGGGGGADASVISVGSAASAAPPVPSINTPQNTPTTTSFDSNGKNLNVIPKTQVVETELTSTQRDVKRINEQATF